MAELDPAHVEAVADLVAHVRDQYPRLPTDADSHEIAETLLTSTDPAVHAALLAVPAVREALANAWDEGYDAWPSAAGKAGNHYRYGHPPTGDVDG